MDRELVFIVLAVALCGCALMVGVWLPLEWSPASGPQELERQTWRRIWIPFLPALLVFALLCGWALVEPASAEPASTPLILAALPFVFVAARAVWIATRSLALSNEHITIATVGIFRPRIIVSPRLAKALDKDALTAALEHERAHAHHRDPLRVWLAQLATELLWPAPTASARLQVWKQALEIARDEEARTRGVAGADLAAAMLVSLRHSQGTSLSAAANLTDQTLIAERVTRLLRPLEFEAPTKRRAIATRFLILMGIALAVLVGVEFGEKLIGSLLTMA